MLWEGQWIRSQVARGLGLIRIRMLLADRSIWRQLRSYEAFARSYNGTAAAARGPISGGGLAASRGLIRRREFSASSFDLAEIQNRSHAQSHISSRNPSKRTSGCKLFLRISVLRGRLLNCLRFGCLCCRRLRRLIFCSFLVRILATSAVVF